MSINIVSKIPNFLTLSRIGATIFMVFYYLYAKSNIFEVLFWVFVVAGFSDYFDGYFSRKLKATSNFGKCLDPISDKLLLIASLFILIDAKLINLLVAFTLMTREIIISGLREFLSLQKVPLPVSRLSKWKTSFQLIAVGYCFFLGSPITPCYYEAFTQYAIFYPIKFIVDNAVIGRDIFIILAVYTTIHSGVSYIYHSARYLK
jgi:CDP-diacylglycerol--glycerol-3-phosphate 3-phosphatidyltransferase